MGGVCCAAAGRGFGQAAGLGLKERVLRICKAATGHRLLFDALTVCGTRVERVHFITASYRNWPAVAHATRASTSVMRARIGEALS